MKLARHTIILIIAAVVLLAAAFISLISEKLSVNRLYEDLLNGREPEPDLEQSKIKIIAYVFAWLKYLGQVFTTAGNLGDTVRSAFTDIHIPKKDEFIK